MLVPAGWIRVDAGETSPVPQASIQFVPFECQKLFVADLRMNAAYIKISLGGCDMGASYFLPRLIGASVAAEYLLTGKFMTADKALVCGLVSAVVPAEDLLDTAMALAGEMLLTSPMGLRLTKDALNLNIDAGSMEHAFALEDRQQMMLSGTADTVEARNAFFEKRPPVWGDR